MSLAVASSPFVFWVFGGYVLRFVGSARSAVYLYRFHVQKRPAHSKCLPVCDVGVRFNMKEGEKK